MWSRKQGFEHVLVRGLCIGVSVVTVLLIAGWWGWAQWDQPNPVIYKFTLGRIQFSTRDLNWQAIRGTRGLRPPWTHDFPRGEEHLMKIIGEVTAIDVNEHGHYVSFDDEELFKFPIAYLCEVGFLDLSEKEIHNMREYLLRGGFLIVDDFRGECALDNFKDQLKLVFPDRTLEELPRSHTIFNCFYDISNVFPIPPYERGLTPQYLGMADDHDRLMMVVDYNNDLMEYWEWADDPFRPIDPTNESYKYGLNYVIYALTH